MIEIIKPEPSWRVLKGKIDPGLCETLGEQIIGLAHMTLTNEEQNKGGSWAEDSLSPGSEAEATVQFEVLSQIAKSELNPCAPYTRYSIDRAWGQVHEKNMGTDWHTHGADKWAVVVYLQTPPGSGRLMFENPWFTLDRDPYIPRTQKLDFMKMPPPEVGDWVCFPSWVKHKVERNNSDEIRASYAFNFFPVG
jgi:uncharacterized protein (TIGR02466 family)